MPGILANTEVSQKVQLAMEAVEGTDPAAAYRLMPDWEIVPGWGVTGRSYIASTFKFPTIRQHGKEWSTFTVRGPLSFTTFLYIVSSAGHYAAPSTPTGATTARKWTNTWQISGLNTSKSYSIEFGNSTTAYRATGAHCVGFTITVNYDECSFEAQFIARRLVPGITMFATPTTILQKPVAGSFIDILTASTFAGLLTAPTFLLHAYTYELSIQNIYGQEWPLHSTNISFDGRYENRPAATLRLTALEQTTGSDFTGVPFSLADMRAGNMNYLRLRARGEAIEAGATAFAVNSITITNGGVGFDTVPTVGFTGGTPVTPATATAVLQGGVVTDIIITEPGNYSEAPTGVTFTGGTPETPATATLSTSLYYDFIIDTALIQDEGPPERSYMDGLTVVTWPQLIASDGTASKAIEFQMVNAISAL